MAVYGFVIRQSRNLRNIDTIKLLYTSLVRPKLEFASIIWSQYYAINVNAIEKIQKKMLTYLFFRKFNYYTVQVPYVELLSMFDLQQLSLRRATASILYIRKLVRGEVDDVNIMGKINFVVPRSTTRSRALFYIPHCRTNYTLNSPVNSMIQSYNRVARFLRFGNFVHSKK